jgi:hypothetical protein
MEHPVPILRWFRIFGRDVAYWPAAQACFGAEGSGLSKACHIEARSKRQRTNGHSLAIINTCDQPGLRAGLFASGLYGIRDAWRRPRGLGIGSSASCHGDLPFLEILLGLRQFHDVGRRHRAEAAARAHPPAGQDHRRGELKRQQASIVRQLSVIRDMQGVLFRGFDRRAFRADCSAFLSRSRSSFNSEI